VVQVQVQFLAIGMSVDIFKEIACGGLAGWVCGMGEWRGEIMPVSVLCLLPYSLFTCTRTVQLRESFDSVQ
jgi:hypothetical protein